MVAVKVIDRSGKELMVEAQAGQSLMEAIRDANIGDLAAICDGSCACGTCHVYVDEVVLGLFPPQGAAENELLGAADARTAQSRLSCQLKIFDALPAFSATIAPDD